VQQAFSDLHGGMLAASQTDKGMSNTVPVLLASQQYEHCNVLRCHALGLHTSTKAYAIVSIACVYRAVLLLLCWCVSPSCFPPSRWL
jgi:hypothetical protein